MNQDYEKQLEAKVRQELDALGDMSAPPALANRILRTIKQRAAVPWYRQSWELWPFGWRMASLAALLVVFGGLAYGSSQLTRGGAGQGVLGNWFADAGALWRVWGVLTDAAHSVIGGFGQGIVFGGAALLFVAAVTCIGLCTAYVRLASRAATNRI